MKKNAYFFSQMSREQVCGSLWSVVGTQKNAGRLLFTKNLEICFYKIFLAANNNKNVIQFGFCE